MEIYLNNEKIAEAENISFKHPKEKEIKEAIANQLAAVGIISEADINSHYIDFLGLIGGTKRPLSDELLPLDKNLRKKMIWKDRIKTMQKQ